MSRKSVELIPAGVHTADGWASVQWQLTNTQGEEAFTLLHSLPDTHAHLLPSPTRGDHAIVAVLLHLMKQGSDVRIRGAVSPMLLDGLDTLQAIWQRWRPRRYRRIDIIADEERPPKTQPGERHGLFAFSGGVDASFSLFRHLQHQAGRNSRHPGAALLVHGMDIPLERDDFFEGASTRAARILAGTEVELLRLKTNSRQLGQDWEDSFGLQLSACFLLAQSGFRYSVRGSGEPYNTLLMPWGSTPMTDPLGNTEAIIHVHDGADYDRTEKVDWLSRNTGVTGDLRVCWAGAQLDRNCGECEKCVRTMLNFWSMGHPVPAAFSTSLTPERVRTVNPKNEVQRRELRSLLTHARLHHAKGDPILDALESVLRRATIGDYRQRASNVVRRLIGRS